MYIYTCSWEFLIKMWCIQCTCTMSFTITYNNFADNCHMENLAAKFCELNFCDWE